MTSGGDEEPVPSGVVGDAKESGQVTCIDRGGTVCRVADGVAGQVAWPVAQVSIDDDPIDGGGHGQATVVGPDGGHGAEQGQQCR